jgi:hypothetical protein
VHGAEVEARLGVAQLRGGGKIFARAGEVCVDAFAVEIRVSEAVKTCGIVLSRKDDPHAFLVCATRKKMKK